MGKNFPSTSSANSSAAHVERPMKIVDKKGRNITLKDQPFVEYSVSPRLINGNIMVGENVQVLFDKQFMDGQIAHVKDLSRYKVVFNDGDEKSLRRNQMVLKGAKHFDSQINLDNCPLDNPDRTSTEFGNEFFIGTSRSVTRQLKAIYQGVDPEHSDTPTRGGHHHSQGSNKLAASEQSSYFSISSNEWDSDGESASGGRLKRRKPKPKQGSAQPATPKPSASSGSKKRSRRNEDGSGDSADETEEESTAPSRVTPRKKPKTKHAESEDSPTKKDKKKPTSTPQSSTRNSTPAPQRNQIENELAEGVLVMGKTKQDKKVLSAIGIIVSRTAYLDQEDTPRPLESHEHPVRTLPDGKLKVFKASQLECFEESAFAGEQLSSKLRKALDMALRYTKTGQLPEGWSEESIFGVNLKTRKAALASRKRRRSRSPSELSPHQDQATPINSSSGTWHKRKEVREQFFARLAQHYEAGQLKFKHKNPQLPNNKWVDLVHLFRLVRKRGGVKEMAAKHWTDAVESMGLKKEMDGDQLKEVYTQRLESFESMLRKKKDPLWFGDKDKKDKHSPRALQSSSATRSSTHAGSMSPAKKGTHFAPRPHSNDKQSRKSARTDAKSTDRKNSTPSIGSASSSTRVKSPTELDQDDGHLPADIFSQLVETRHVRAAHYSKFYSARVVDARRVPTDVILRVVTKLVAALHPSKLQPDGSVERIRITNPLHVDALEELGRITMVFVHYCGWNNRYDEWVTLDRLKVTPETKKQSMLALMKSYNFPLEVLEAVHEFYARRRITEASYNAKRDKVPNTSSDEEDAMSLTSMTGKKKRNKDLNPALLRMVELRQELKDFLYEDQGHQIPAVKPEKVEKDAFDDIPNSELAAANAVVSEAEAHRPNNTSATTTTSSTTVALLSGDTPKLGTVAKRKPKRLDLSLEAGKPTDGRTPATPPQQQDGFKQPKMERQNSQSAAARQEDKEERRRRKKENSDASSTRSDSVPSSPTKDKRKEPKQPDGKEKSDKNHRDEERPKDQAEAKDKKEKQASGKEKKDKSEKADKNNTVVDEKPPKGLKDSSSSSASTQSTAAEERKRELERRKEEREREKERRREDKESRRREKDETDKRRSSTNDSTPKERSERRDSHSKTDKSEKVHAKDVKEPKEGKESPASRKESLKKALEAMEIKPEDPMLALNETINSVAHQLYTAPTPKTPSPTRTVVAGSTSVLPSTTANALSSSAPAMTPQAALHQLQGTAAPSPASSDLAARQFSPALSTMTSPRGADASPERAYGGIVNCLQQSFNDEPRPGSSKSSVSSTSTMSKKRDDWEATKRELRRPLGVDTSMKSPTPQLPSHASSTATQSTVLGFQQLIQPDDLVPDEVARQFEVHETRSPAPAPPTSVAGLDAAKQRKRADLEQDSQLTGKDVQQMLVNMGLLAPESANQSIMSTLGQQTAAQNSLRQQVEQTKRAEQELSAVLLKHHLLQNQVQMQFGRDDPALLSAAQLQLTSQALLFAQRKRQELEAQLQQQEQQQQQQQQLLAQHPSTSAGAVMNSLAGASLLQQTHLTMAQLAVSRRQQFDLAQAQQLLQQQQLPSRQQQLYSPLNALGSLTAAIPTPSVQQTPNPFAAFNGLTSATPLAQPAQQQSAASSSVNLLAGLLQSSGPTATPVLNSMPGQNSDQIRMSLALIEQQYGSDIAFRVQQELETRLLSQLLVSLQQQTPAPTPPQQQQQLPQHPLPAVSAGLLGAPRSTAGLLNDLSMAVTSAGGGWHFSGSANPQTLLHMDTLATSLTPSTDRTATPRESSAEAPSTSSSSAPQTRTALTPQAQQQLACSSSGQQPLSQVPTSSSASPACSSSSGGGAGCRAEVHLERLTEVGRTSVVLDENERQEFNAVVQQQPCEDCGSATPLFQKAAINTLPPVLRNGVLDYFAKQQHLNKERRQRPQLDTSGMTRQAQRNAVEKRKQGDQLQEMREGSAGESVLSLDQRFQEVKRVYEVPGMSAVLNSIGYDPYSPEPGPEAEALKRSAEADVAAKSADQVEEEVRKLLRENNASADAPAAEADGNARRGVLNGHVNGTESFEERKRRNDQELQLLQKTLFGMHDAAEREQARLALANYSLDYSEEINGLVHATQSEMERQRLKLDAEEEERREKTLDLTANLPKSQVAKGRKLY